MSTALERPHYPIRKSTNVRFIATWLGLQALARVAPARAERLVLDLFSTPRRRPEPALPVVPELPGRAFRPEVRGRTLAAWEWGDPGPTVLLAHGWSGDAAQMTAFVAPLVAAGLHVVAFDQPGHGLSPGARSSVLDLRDAVLALGQRVGPLRAVIAHSLGAAGTALAAADGLPVERLVLIAPPLEPGPYAQQFARALGLSAARADGVAERARQFLAARHGTHDLCALVPSLRTRLLLVHDRDDRRVPVIGSERLAATAPAARLLTTRGLGHERVLRDPEVVAAAVEFVSPAQGGASRMTALSSGRRNGEAKPRSISVAPSITRS